MPHIIVEYPDSISEQFNITALLNNIHRSVADSGLFDESHIKTRSYSFKDFTNAGGNEPYIHIQARIKSGRDDENKKQLSDTIINGIKLLNIPVSVVTVEIIDMDRDSYGKIKY